MFHYIAKDDQIIATVTGTVNEEDLALRNESLVSSQTPLNIGFIKSEDGWVKPEKTVEDLKQSAKLKVYEFSAGVRAKLTGYADQYKVAGWNDKFQRAQRVIANTASDADIAILQAECDKRGKSETPQELAQKQAAKGQALATAVAIIDGMESAALDAIESKRSENTLAALLDDLQTQASQQLQQLLGEHNA